MTKASTPRPAVHPAPAQPAPVAPIRPHTTVAEIAASPLVDMLNPRDMVIYLKLVAMTDGLPGASSSIAPKNHELHSDRRSTTAALAALAKLGLISVSYGAGMRRTIEVVR